MHIIGVFSKKLLIIIIIITLLFNLELKYYLLYIYIYMDSITNKVFYEEIYIKLFQDTLKHFNNICKPCLFNIKGICYNELKCNFCHFYHINSKSFRPSKSKRKQLKSIINDLIDKNTDKSKIILRELAIKEKYAGKLLENKIIYN